jgi:hypothetical protein
MTKRRSAILLSLMLAACSSHPDILPVAAYVPPSPPTQKQIVASSWAVAKEAKLVGPLQISAVRQSDHGPGSYFVCLKEANPLSNEPRCYALFFNNDAFKGERLSVMIDECEKQTFSPLPAAPPDPTVPAPTDPAANAKHGKHKRDHSLIQ